jgi:hypothetical protein
MIHLNEKLKGGKKTVHPTAPSGSHAMRRTTILLALLLITVGFVGAASAAANNVYFATIGLPSGTSVSVGYSGTNNGNHTINSTSTFLSPGPSSPIGTLPGSSFTFYFPTISGYTYTAPSSPITTGESGGSTTITATYTAAGTAPSVTTQPVDLTITYGSDATFSANASGTPTPTVQWQVSTNGGTIFRLQRVAR